jgi:hypothetical protein
MLYACFYFFVSRSLSQSHVLKCKLDGLTWVLFLLFFNWFFLCFAFEHWVNLRIELCSFIQFAFYRVILVSLLGCRFSKVSLIDSSKFFLFFLIWFFFKFYLLIFNLLELSFIFFSFFIVIMILSNFYFGSWRPFKNMQRICIFFIYCCLVLNF